MTRPLSRWQSSALGLLVCGLLVGGGWALFRIGDRQQLWQRSGSLTASFDHVQGIGPGTPVRVRGIEAGSVQAIEWPTGASALPRIVVRLRIDQRALQMLYADASASIVSEGMIGGKAIEIAPGHAERGPCPDGAEIASHSLPDLNSLVAEARDAIRELRDGQGSLGKLLRDDQAYHDLVGTLAQAKKLIADGQDATKTIQRDAEVLQKLPIVRGYAGPSPVDLLVRPRMTQHRQVIDSNDLFEPGRAVLTEAGQAKLDAVGEWLLSHREAGSQLVLVAYAEPNAKVPESVHRRLTQEQAEAASQYLRDKHAANKLGRWPWQTREVACLGRGSEAPLQPEASALPPARLEVLVFVP